jgi:hypothetical protein
VRRSLPAAAHAALPSIVGAPLLPRALARNQTRDFLLSLAGPIAGASLFSRSAALPFALDAVSYALSLALLVPMRPEAVEYSAPARARPTGAAIRSGLALLRRRPVLRDAGLCLAMLNLLLTGSTFGLIVLTQSGGPHPIAAGTIITAQAAGGLMGSLMADRVAHRLGPRAVVLLQVWVWVAALSAFALAPPLGVMLVLSAAVWSVTCCAPWSCPTSPRPYRPTTGAVSPRRSSCSASRWPQPVRRPSAPWRRHSRPHWRCWHSPEALWSPPPPSRR